MTLIYVRKTATSSFPWNQKFLKCQTHGGTHKIFEYAVIGWTHLEGVSMHLPINLFCISLQTHILQTMGPGVALRVSFQTKSIWNAAVGWNEWTEYCTCQHSWQWILGCIKLAFCECHAFSIVFSEYCCHILMCCLQLPCTCCCVLGMY